MKKGIYLLLALFFLKSMISCRDCEETVVYQVQYNAISSKHIDNSGATPYFIDQGTIDRDAYGILLVIDYEKYAHHFNSAPLGFSELMAKSSCPPEFEFVPTDSIEAIRIYTQLPFNDTIAAQADITDLFMWWDNYEYRPLSSIFSDTLNYIHDRRPYYNGSLNDQLRLDFYLLTPPKNAGEYSFNVEIEFSSGQFLSNTTSPITLD